jgi:hypothetical protein
MVSNRSLSKFLFAAAAPMMQMEICADLLLKCFAFYRSRTVTVMPAMGKNRRSLTQYFAAINNFWQLEH